MKFGFSFVIELSDAGDGGYSSVGAICRVSSFTKMKVEYHRSLASFLLSDCEIGLFLLFPVPLSVMLVGRSLGFSAQSTISVITEQTPNHLITSESSYSSRQSLFWKLEKMK